MSCARATTLLAYFVMSEHPFEYTGTREQFMPETQADITTADALSKATSARFPAFSREEQRAGIGLLRELARGEPLNLTRWAQRLDVPDTHAETLLRSSQLSPFVQMGTDGQVLGFWGLSTVPTHHQLTIDGGTLWAWCAVDSLFLPELLDVTARIISRDAESDESIELTVSPSGVESVTPEGVLVSVNSPETWELSAFEKIIKSACHFVYYFASRESGERWALKHAGAVLVSLETAFAFGHRLNDYAFASELSEGRA